MDGCEGTHMMVNMLPAKTCISFATQKHILTYSARCEVSTSIYWKEINWSTNSPWYNELTYNSLVIFDNKEMKENVSLKVKKIT